MSVASETPSSRALRHLNNRNNVADLFLRKRLEQMEREKNFYMSYLDKDRLDITDFLKNLHKCESDDLPQSKIYLPPQNLNGESGRYAGVALCGASFWTSFFGLAVLKGIREEWDSEDDLSDDVSVVPHRRKTHTAKTAPPRFEGQRKAEDDEEEEADCVSLAQRPPRRLAQTGVPSRRQMLAQRRQEDRRAMESAYEKTEIFLQKLRQDVNKEEMGGLRQYFTRHEFTAFLLDRIRGGDLHQSEGAFWDGGEWGGGGGREDYTEGSDGERRWARSRLDMLYPIKKLGNIASRFQDSGRNTPAGAEGSKSRWFGAPLKRMLGESDSRVNSAQGKQRQRSIFDINESDAPSHLLPRPAGMPDFNRARRDTLVDTARAFGFGEAALVASKGSPVPQESSPSLPPAQVNPFSRAALAERRRLERQTKVKTASKPPPSQKDDPHGTDMIRALMQIKSRFRHKPLDDRIRNFMRELDDAEKAHPNRYRSDCT